MVLSPQHESAANLNTSNKLMLCRRHGLMVLIVGYTGRFRKVELTRRLLTINHIYYLPHKHLISYGISIKILYLYAQHAASPAGTQGDIAVSRKRKQEFA